jgi:hypothetical protein
VVKRWWAVTGPMPYTGGMRFCSPREIKNAVKKMVGTPGDVQHGILAGYWFRSLREVKNAVNFLDISEILRHRRSRKDTQLLIQVHHNSNNLYTKTPKRK